MQELAIVLPLARLEAALQGDQLALAQVLGTDLREAIPRHHRVKLGFLLAAAVLVGGDAELGDHLRVGERAHLGVAGQATGQQDAVHAYLLRRARACRRASSADGGSDRRVFSAAGGRQRRSDVSWPDGRSDASSARSVQMTCRTLATPPYRGL